MLKGKSRDESFSRVDTEARKRANRRTETNID
jgi:hypothetical protein